MKLFSLDTILTEENLDGYKMYCLMNKNVSFLYNNIQEFPSGLRPEGKDFQGMGGSEISTTEKHLISK